jgi:hypothetical protein
VVFSDTSNLDIRPIHPIAQIETNMKLYDKPTSTTRGFAYNIYILTHDIVSHASI